MRPEPAVSDAPSATEPPRSAGTAVRRHASCVAIGDEGVLLLGRSGSGKSDLALRLIDGGAGLVADDQVVIERCGDDLIARAPKALQGLIEVRGIGILRLPARSWARLTLAIELARPRERLPERADYPLLGVRLPLVILDPFAPSAPAALRLALGAERVA